MAVQLVAREPRIPPSRGLVLSQNHAGKPLKLIDLLRWVRYNRVVLATDAEMNPLSFVGNGMSA